MVLAISPFESMSQVTPFTARDNASYLQKLNGLRNKLNELIEHVDLSDTQVREEFDAKYGQLVTDLNTELANTRNSLDVEIEGFDARLVEMYATSNAGLDDRVTEAETKVSVFMDYVDSLAGLSDPIQTPAEMLAGLADMQNGSVSVAVASDSTANDATDWVRIFTRMYADYLTAPDLRCEYRSWNDTTQAWNAPTVDKAGTIVPASGGTIVSDTFTRSGETVGTVPNVGAQWKGKVGVWTCDGDGAKQAGTLTGGIWAQALSALGNPIRDLVLNASLKLVSSASAIAQTWRFYVGAPALSSDQSTVTGGVYVYLSVSASGAVTAGIATTINGVSATITTFNLSGSGILSVSPDVQNISVTVAIDGLNVSGSLQKDAGAPVTVTGTLTESDRAWLGGYGGVSASTTASPGLELDAVTLTAPVVPAPPQQGLTVHNGAVAGATVLYHKPRVALMWPVKPDVLVIGTGHNNAAMGTDDFIDLLDGFIATCAQVWGSLPRILVTSQNPQNVAATFSAQHALRQAAIRQWAMSNGYQYLPAFERFVGAPASMMNIDGIHPSVPAAWPLAQGDTTLYGSVEWAKLLDIAVNARRYRATV